MKLNVRGLLLVMMSAAMIACATSPVNKQILADGKVKYDGSTSQELGKSNTISGYVYSTIDRRDRPVAGATVEIKNVNLGMGYYKLVTDSDGFFEVKDIIPHIRYMVEVSAPGYISRKYTDEFTYNKSFDVYIDKASILKGVVTGASGAPVAGTEVKLAVGRNYDSDSEDGVKASFATTNEKGEYIFDSVKSGRYLVTFRKEGYISETAQIRNIEVGETFTLPMHVFRKSSVSGKITIKGIGVPAINMQVSLSGKYRHYATTFQDGSYRIEDLKPGTYMLRLSHQGFYSPNEQKIVIDEGKEREGLDFIVVPKEARLEISAHRYTFTPGSKVEFSIKSLRLEKINVIVYRVPIEVLLRGKTDPNKIDPVTEKFTKVKEWEDLVKNFDPYEWRYNSLETGDALPEGGYCIEVSGAGNVISRKYFTVTSVGLVVKRSRSSVFAYVTDMVTNAPIRDASIVVFDNTKVGKRRDDQSTPQRIEDLPVSIVNKGKTDENGIYHHPLKNEMLLSVLAIGKNNCFAFCSTGSPVTFAQEESKYFIYTDRPVYRAGDKVFYKIIGKKREERFTPQNAKKIFYEIKNNDTGTVLKSGEYHLDDWGATNDMFELSDDINLGEHEIRVGPSPDNLYSAGRFYVEQYRKPEFSIALTPMKSFYSNGDSAEFKVEAKYFFGAPLKGARVSYRFYERKLRDSDSLYWWEDDYTSQDTYDKIKDEGDRALDDNGLGVLRMACGKYPYDREITVEATVVDKSNISITSKATVRVGRGDFYIKVNPSQGFFASDEKKQVVIKTVAQDGMPVSADVSVKVYRYIWKPWERVYVHDKRPIAEHSLTTSSKGEALFELPKKMDIYGEFDIVVEAKDKKENSITASHVIWVYSGSAAKVDSRFKNLELALSETDLKGPGEITCLLKSRFPDAYVCITLEGKDVYDKKVVKMNGNIMAVKIPIKLKYAPNLFVTATMQRNRALFTHSVGVSLPDPDTVLSIKLTPDKTKYLPGEKATIKVNASDSAGKPVSADLSLGVVDEAIYAIRYDHTPKMKDYFYTKISNWVLTSYSYPITVLAGAAKEGKVKVREKFDDTAFWQANIRTDRSGQSTVSFTLPDNLTTWRLTARGHDRSGRVGEKRSEILVTQDLIARIGKPRFFTEGDTVGLIGMVTSNTSRGLEKISTEMKFGDTVLAADEKDKISLPPYGTSSTYYTANVPSLKDSMSVQYTALGDKEARDSLINKIPVRPRGTPFSMFANGDMVQSRVMQMQPIESTEDFEFAPDQLVISVNPSPIALMLKTYKYLNEYPYGCVEQTINKYLPNIALKRILDQKGFDKVIEVKELNEKIKVGTDRVLSMQNDDGSWGWWHGDRGNEFITAYVLQSMHSAKAWGYDVDERRIKNGLNAIQRMLDTRNVITNDGKSFLMYVNSLWGSWSNAAYDDLSKSKYQNAYQLAYMIRASVAASHSKNISREQYAVVSAQLPQLVAKLKSMMQKDEKGVYWPSSNSSWSWQGGRAEVTAQVLSALCEAGDTSTIPSQIVNSLSRRSRGGNYLSTKEASQVILAFCSFLERQKNVSRSGGNSTITFMLDGKEAAKVTYNKDDVANINELVKKVKLDKSIRKNTFKLEAVGDINPDVTFDVSLKGFLYYKDKGFLSLVKSEDRSLGKLENGISLVRSFGAIRRVRDKNNYEYMVPQPITDASQIKVGDEILVKMKFQPHDSFEYLVLEDFLPAGFEVVNNNIYDEYVPYSHQERWDDKMVFFFTKLNKGEVYELAYVIRAELPGDFIAKPAKVECMYEPSVQGWSAPARFKVKKNPAKK